MVKLDNQWGTVCNDNFGKKEADIACKTLGFVEGAFRYTSADPKFTSDVPILMDEVDCTNRTDFLECSHEGWESEDCFHSEDILITCKYLDAPFTKAHFNFQVVKASLTCNKTL